MTYNIAQKIKALYADRKDIDWRNSKEAIQQTVALLSSGGLHSAWVCTGTSKGYYPLNGLLALRPNINVRVYALIYVNGRDEYCIDYVSVKSEAAEIITHRDGIFFDELAAAYEHMYDGYINEAQGGFIRI